MLAAAALAGVLAVGLGAESRARIVHISFLAPPVQSRSAAVLPPARWMAALLNAPVVEGESLRTGSAGEAEIELECGSAVRLAPNSRLTFSHLRRRNDGVAATTITLQRGRFFFSLRRADARDFHLKLPGARLETVQGSKARFQMRVPNGRAGSIQVTAGAAKVRVGATVYEVKKSNRLVWTAAGAVRQLPLRVDADAWAAWSRSRDRKFDRALIASRPRPEVAAVQVRGLPAPSAPPGSPASAFSAWPILAAGAAAGRLPAAPLASGRAATVPVCARY